jgi:NitT/TauT family transport system permease protein
MLDLLRMLRASGEQTFLKVRLPNALPSILDGCKIALPLALIGAIVGEFVAARQGIGQQILLAYANFNTPLVFAAVVVVAIMATLLFQLLVLIERLVLGWRPRTSV